MIAVNCKAHLFVLQTYKHTFVLFFINISKRKPYVMHDIFHSIFLLWLNVCTNELTGEHQWFSMQNFELIRLQLTKTLQRKICYV